MKEEYAKGEDGKILWCWKCKNKIKKGEKIYPGFEGKIGKFICENCKKEVMKLKTLNEIIGKLRYLKYKGKKATGYDFFKMQEALEQELIKWAKAIKEGRRYSKRFPCKRVGGILKSEDFIKYFLITMEEDLK